MPLDLDRNERDSGRFTREDALLNLSDRPSDDARDDRVGDPAVALASRNPGPSPGGLGAGALAAAAAHGSHLWAERARTAFAGFKSQSPAALIDRAGAQSRALAARVADAWGRVRPRLGLKSLYWRILIVNLSGLALTLVGILYLISQQDWLIEAKRESIQSQAQVIVDAIVREASNEDRGLGFPDPDRLLEGGRDQSFNPPPYGLQDFEFAIQPEKVAPILQRYSQSSGQRARIYARDGTMIYDSAGLSSRVSRRDLPEIGQSDSPMITSFWTRLDSLFMPNNLPVYKEIGRGNGRAYPEVVAALEGQSMPMLMVNDRGSHLVSVAMPIQRMKAVQGALLLSTRDGDIDGIRRKERHLITWIFVVASIATGMTALALAGTIARPMRKLSDAALAVKRNIGAAKDLPTFPDHKDEIGQMASAFRDMTVALYKRIELSEKFAADVAHELKNPVTAVRSATESLTYVTNEKDRQELLHNIQVDLKRLNKLITDISNFSRLDAELSLNESEPVDVTRLATGIAAAFNDMRGTGQNPKPVLIQIDNAGASRPVEFLVSGHEGRLGQVLTNLLDNALSFSPADGRVWVRLREAEGEIEVVVEDEGPGIPEDRFDKIFERFYTDRPDSEATQGKNSGLGLSITQEIVAAHAGRIWAENRLADDGSPVRGARFVVMLPALPGGRRPNDPPKGAWRS